MPAVHVKLSDPAGPLGQARARIEQDGVLGLAAFMLQCAGHLLRDMLQQRPSKVHVQRLHPETNAEYRLSRIERMFQDSPVGCIALHMNRFRPRMAAAAHSA